MFLVSFIVALLGLNLFLKDISFHESNEQLSIRNNLWAHFGTKSIKSKLYELEKNNLNFLLSRLTSEEDKVIAQTLIANLDSEIARYKEEKSEQSIQALEADTKYQKASNKFRFFSLAFIVAIFALSAFFMKSIFLVPNEEENPELCKLANIKIYALILISLLLNIFALFFL